MTVVRTWTDYARDEWERYAADELRAPETDEEPWVVQWVPPHERPDRRPWAVALLALAVAVALVLFLRRTS